MAYIATEKVKEIREELKKAFPAFKFSVQRDNYSAVRVKIVSGPVRFSERNDEQLNHYYPDRYQNAEILKGMIKIIDGKGQYYRMDHGMDYPEVGYYVTISQGSWDRPYVVKGGK